MLLHVSGALPPRPSARQPKKLTDFEKKTGRRYSVMITNIRHMWAIAGSHQIQFLDIPQHDRAEVGDGSAASRHDPQGPTQRRYVDLGFL